MPYIFTYHTYVIASNMLGATIYIPCRLMLRFTDNPRFSQSGNPWTDARISREEKFILVI
jgi:hypothetical protein